MIYISNFVSGTRLELYKSKLNLEKVSKIYKYTFKTIFNDWNEFNDFI